MTRDDLRDLREDLVDRINTGFAGLNSRLDLLNSRTGKNEVSAAEAALRVTNIERELFKRPKRSESRDEDRPALTRREWTLIWTSLGAAIPAVMWLLERLR